jgi:hypothetical protein
VADEPATTEAGMDTMDLDMDDTVIATFEETFDEEEYGCDDVRPAWLSAELLNLDAETQMGFNAVWQDR